MSTNNLQPNKLVFSFLVFIFSFLKQVDMDFTLGKDLTLVLTGLLTHLNEYLGWTSNLYKSILYSQPVNEAFAYVKDNNLEDMFVATITHPYMPMNINMATLRPCMEVDFVLQCTDHDIDDMGSDGAHKFDKHVTPRLVQSILANTLQLNKSKTHAYSGGDKVHFTEPVVSSVAYTQPPTTLLGGPAGISSPFSSGGGAIPKQNDDPFNFGNAPYPSHVGGNPGGGGGSPPPDDDPNNGDQHVNYRNSGYTTNRGHDNKAESGRCSYADRHRFYESILKKNKLKSTDPLHVLNHLRRFSRWMIHSPPFLELSVKINIFFDTLIGPPPVIMREILGSLP